MIRFVLVVCKVVDLQ